MGCRNRELSEEETAVSASIGDALLFTTMCIIGLPIDVHIKDGSIYTGIFHTVCVEDDYAIVLKRARMTKKGNHGANVSNGGVIETLVVLSEDLVQVDAKGVILPPNGFTGNAVRDDVGASIELSEGVEKLKISSKTDAGRKQATPTSRCSSRPANGFVNGFTPRTASQSGNALEVEIGESCRTDLAKKEETSSSPAIARQVGDSELREKQGAYEDKYKYKRNLTMRETTHKVLPTCDNPAPSVIKLNGQYQERSPLEETPHSNATTAGISSAVSSVADITSESSTNLPEMNPPKSSSSNRIAKEFKLNPGAKIFSPSFVNQRSTTPPAVTTATSVTTCVQDNCSGLPIPTGHPEVKISPFAPPRSSLPVKFLPYSNLVPGNGGTDIQYSQPIVGHIGNRAQPTRYAGQYHHPVQAGPTYVHPNSQNVMVGRLAPLVYVHPISHDVVQGATAFSQVSTCPLLTPQQVHLRKHQGNAAAAQALQLCVTTPPFIANGQQPFTVPAHIPNSQQAFPVIRPIPLPGTNGFLASKFS